jgi:hypothetical protein
MPGFGFLISPAFPRNRGASGPAAYGLDAQPGTYTLTGAAATLTYTPSSAWDFEHDFTGGTLPTNATFARADAGTRINSSGVLESITANNPRYDYNPATLAARGLLMEAARTNLFTQSTALNANWTGQNESSTDAAAAAPDGATAATRIIDNSATGSAEVGFSSPSVTVATSSAY